MRQTVLPGHTYSDWAGKKGNAAGKGARTGAARSTRPVTERPAAPESTGRTAYTKEVQYDVSAGASRVAEIMNEDPYLAASRDAAIMQGREEMKGTAAQPSAGSVEEEAAEETLDEEAAAEAEKKKEKTEKTEKNTAPYSQEDIDYMERMLERMKEARSKVKNSKSKKKLVYSYRRISGSIMRAKTKMQAGNALTSAKSTLSNLKRKLGTGQYKDDELKIAINHASKMVRTARKKVAHLKQEEWQDRNDDDIVQSRERDNEEVKLENHQKEEFLEIAIDLDQEIQLLEKRLNQITKAEKNSNRRNENYDLLVADMEYLKKKLGLMIQEEKDESGSTGQVSGMGTGSADAAVQQGASAQEATPSDMSGVASAAAAQSAAAASTPPAGFDATV